MIILIGKSGSGKSTIQNELLKRGYNVSINYTTRNKRKNEVDGIDYHFITKEEFEKLWKEDKIIERSMFNNNFYGIGIEAAKEDIVCILDPNGLKQMKDKNISITSFYITLSEEELRNRMITRGDSLDEINTKIILDNERFVNAENKVDYVVENIDLDKTVEFIIKKSI